MLLAALGPRVLVSKAKFKVHVCARMVYDPASPCKAAQEFADKFKTVTLIPLSGKWAC